ncbi:FAD-binding protein [Streptomyces sp. MBT33]|uniref:FAD-binding protein n=1 Tax=Streptomyces sp. MBT33 TaxID=1488363 RepID=UPI00190C6B85|nr:FAD-binding protein [Streptomyces sp. MBT33]MBK3644705.1 FAD-binding protein [Streptomyces sp. MBT33]
MKGISESVFLPGVPTGHLAEAEDDFGHIIASLPLGVLAARSADAVRELVSYAGPRGLPVAARGSGHALYGQGQAHGGYVVDMRPLNEVRCTPGDRTLSAGAGASWSEVVRAALVEGLAPPVLPDHLGTSVGGVLSTGGFGATSHRRGLVADWVRDIDVVTGTGTLLTCSRERHRELFDAVLAGLGQCALIVRATLRLLPAPARVRRFRLFHSTPEAYLTDQRRLCRDGRFSHVCGQARPAVGGAWTYAIEAVAPHTAELPTEDALLIGDLDHDRDTVEIEDLPYEEFLHRPERDERLLRASGEWQRPHPWLSLLLPEDTAAAFVPAVLADPAQRGLRTCGVVQLRPLTGETLRTPLLRRPPADHLCLLTLMRTAPTTDPVAVEELVAANRTVYERALAVGGVLHPVSALPMTPADWRGHFGPVWPDLAHAKDRHDPHHILTRGYGLWP